MTRELEKARAAIASYIPSDSRQAQNKQQVLECIRYFPNVLTRENSLFHLTSSALILNQTHQRVLFCHHNIFKTWCWTGGHTDGCGDLLLVAKKEAQEECGIQSTQMGYAGIASIDILSVAQHEKRGKTVLPHLHLSIAYALIADDSAPIHAQKSEISAVCWIDWQAMPSYSREPELIEIYQRIHDRAREYKNNSAEEDASHASNAIIL